MNKVYKVVWSKVKNAYVVVSELAKSHTKSPKSRVIGRTLVAGVLACMLSCGAIKQAMAAMVFVPTKNGSIDTINFSYDANDFSVATESAPWTESGVETFDRLRSMRYISEALGDLSDYNLRYRGIDIMDNRLRNYSDFVLPNVSVSDVLQELDSHKNLNGYDARQYFNSLYGDQNSVALAFSNIYGLGSTTAVSDMYNDLKEIVDALSIDEYRMGYGIQLKKDGQIAAGDTRLVTGNTVYEALLHGISVNITESSDNYDNDRAVGANSIAIGTGAHTTNDSAVAIGNGTSAVENYAVAVGPGAYGSGESSVAIGHYASASEDAVAFGHEAVAESETVAIGSNSNASSSGSVALGKDSIADIENTVSVGSSTNQRRIVNVAEGVNNTDVSIVGQTGSSLSLSGSVLSLKAATGDTLSTVTLPAASSDEDTLHYVSIRDYPRAVTKPANYNNDGASNEIYGMAIGAGTTSAGKETTAIGYKNTADGDGSVTVGHSNITESTAAGGMAIGVDNRVNSNGALAVGGHNKSLGDGNLAVGVYNVVEGYGNGTFGERNKIYKSKLNDDNTVDETQGATIGVNIFGMDNTTYNTDASTILGNNSSIANSDGSVLISEYRSSIKNSAASYAVGNQVSIEDSSGSGVFGNDSSVINNSEGGYAFGQGATVDNSTSSVAIGEGSMIQESMASYVLGQDAKVKSSTGSIAIGDGASVEGRTSSVAMGQGTKVINSIASVAIGNGDGSSVSNSTASTAIGQGSRVVNSTASVAIGTGYGSSVSNSTASTAIGQGTSVTGTNGGHAFGDYATILNSDGAVSIGNHAVVQNSSGGTSVGDHNNVISASGSVAMGSGNTVTNVSSMSNGAAVGVGNRITGGEHSVVFGYANVMDMLDNSNSYYSSALGTQNNVFGDYSSAVGYQNKISEAYYASSMGTLNEVYSDYGSAIGYKNIVDVEEGKGSYYGTAIGSQNKVTNGDKNGAIGLNNEITDSNGSIAFGVGNIVTESDSTSGMGISTKITDSDYAVSMGFGSTITSSDDAVALGKSAEVTETTGGFAIGNDSEVSGGSTGSTALGSYAKVLTTSIGSVALGSNAEVRGESNGSAAIGNYAYVEKGNGSYVLGSSSHVKNSNSSNALGNQSRVEDSSASTAVGSSAYVLESEGADAFGNSAYVTGSAGGGAFGAFAHVNNSGGATAIGNAAYVTNGGGSFAAGNNAYVSSSGGAVTMGTGSHVSGADNGLAIGSYAKVENNWAGTAIGNSAETVVDQGVALGSNSKAERGGWTPGWDPFNEKIDYSSTWMATAGAVSVGGKTFARMNSDGHYVDEHDNVVDSAEDAQQVTYTRQITNVAAGSAPSDAVNVAQLQAVADYANVRFVGVKSTDKSDANYKGQGAVALNSIAIGPSASANSVISDDEVAVYNDVKSKGGWSSVATAYQTINGWTNEEIIQNVYGDKTLSEDFLTALFAGTSDEYMESSANAINGVALGYQASVTKTDSVALGSKSVADVSGVVSVGNGELKRRIVNVAEGVEDTDAVNVKQLNEAMASVPAQQDAVLYDAENHTQVTLAGTRGTKMTNLKAAELSRTSTDAVIGNQLWTTNQNLTGMKTDITTNSTNISALNTSVSNALESVTSISMLVDTVNDLKADKSLNNLDDSGKAVIATAAANAVQEYMANSNKVVPMNKVVMNNVVPDDWSSIDDELALKADKDSVYTKDETDTLLDIKANVSYVDDQLSVKANVDDVYVKDEVDTMLGAKADADSVYTKNEADALLADKADKLELDAKADKTDLETKAEVDASNIDVDKWAEKLGTGEIAEGNTGLINGGTVFEAMKNVGGNDLIKEGTNAIEIGSDAKYDGIDSVSIAKSDGSGRVLKGVLVDPADNTSAANVGYVNAIADGITVGVNQGFAKLDDKINKTGAGAAALANLHPIADDRDTKWNIAAGIGRYHGESAGAVGVFYKPSDRVAVNVSSTIGNSDTMFGAGVSVAIDKPMSNGLSKVAMAKKIEQQDVINANLVKRLEQQDAVIAQLQAEMAEMKRAK